MKLRAYARYKTSGVQWLGDVPAHWAVTPLGYLVRFRGGATPDKSRSDYWDGAIPWVSPKDMKAARLSDAEDHVSEDAMRHSPLPMVPRGAVLIVVRGMILAHSFPVALTEGPLTINQDMKALIPGSGLDPTFLSWALGGLARAIVALADESAHGTRKLEMLTLARLPLCAPELHEQRIIARFLDEQTARLDTLIAKERTLIERLLEKRSALISRAVTRGIPLHAAEGAGLDPKPRLNSSGFEWVGDLPSHWTTAQLRRCTRFITSGSRGWAEHYADEGEVFIRIGNLTRNSIRLDLSEIQRVDPPPGAEGERTRVLAGDVLFSITAYLGSVAVVDRSIEGAYINQHVALVRLDAQRANPRFVAYTAMADIGQAQLAGQGYGGTKVQLSLDDVVSMWLPVPPLAEQNAIVNFLDRKTFEVDQLIARVQAAIERLQEYRSALITAAVTGKIDVRAHVRQGLPASAGSG